MGVTISNLTKVFGAQVAVNNISFESKAGEVTGFLGPNGAGKSTTMKMIAGYLRPLTGKINVDGIEVTEQPVKVKSKIGYLPEHNPLYLDMYVREFLGFIGRAHGLKAIDQRVDEMIELVGLTNEQDKRLKMLSKGYRQRVGLAKAMIHNPGVLILDEPTSGLDPNQIQEIRQVIRQVAEHKTVILSTHIMQEVEALCDQVVIIDKGVIVANDTLKNLRSGMDSSPGIMITFESPVDANLFDQEGFEVLNHGEHGFLIRSDRKDLRAELLRITSANDLPLVSLTKSQNTLEEIFQRLTQGTAA